MAHNVVTIDEAAVTIDGVEYSDAISSAVLQATAAAQTWTPINGASQAKVPPPTWAVVLDLGQDYEELSLYHQLVTRHGQRAVVKVEPAGTAGGASFTVDATLVVPTQAGGAAQTIATAQSTLPVSGQPEIIWQPATA